MNKKKVSQSELRKFMSEHRNKLSANGKKIESPLAKYKEDGSLTCIVCEKVVRSEAVWSVHINSKQHKDNIASKKQLLSGALPAPPPLPVYKRPLTPPPVVPQKKLKSILKNAPTPKLPEGFFDSQPGTAPAPAPTLVEDTLHLPSLPLPASTAPTEPMETEPEDSKDLPEGFFDDPILDAKARNVEYKDPIQEEWEKFQREIKEETTVSSQIIEDDQEEATAERQIQEIDEQLRNWSKVLEFEKKKETVQAVSSKPSNDNNEEDLTDEDEDFDEFLDWRAKKSFK